MPEKYCVKKNTVAAPPKHPGMMSGRGPCAQPRMLYQRKLGIMSTVPGMLMVAMVTANIHFLARKRSLA